MGKANNPHESSGFAFGGKGVKLPSTPAPPKSPHKNITISSSSTFAGVRDLIHESIALEPKKGLFGIANKGAITGSTKGGRTNAAVFKDSGGGGVFGGGVINKHAKKQKRELKRVERISGAAKKP